MNRSTLRSSLVRMLGVLLIAAALPATAAAQEGVNFGLGTAGEFGVPQNINRDTYDWCQCGGTGAGRSWRVGGRANLHFIFPNMFLNGFGTALRIGVGGSYGEFESDSYKGETVLMPGSSVPTETTRYFLVEESAITMETSLMARVQIAGGLGFEFGPWSSYRMVDDINQTERLKSSTGLLPGDFQTVRTLASGDAIAAPRLAYGPAAGVHMYLPIYGRFALQPSIYGRANLPMLNKGLERYAFSAGFELGFLFDLSERPDDLADVPLPPVDTASHRAEETLSATLDIYSVDESGGRDQRMTVRGRNILYRQRTPVMGRIYFERGLATLPERYVQLSAGRSSFVLDSLARRDEHYLHYHELNLLGLRMLSDIGATITLTDSSGTGEPDKLGSARAEVIRSYLVDVWGVDKSRIVIKRGKKKGGAVPAVAITSADTDLLSPIVTQWIEEDLSAPQIGLNPKIDASRGVRRWDVSIRQEGREVARYSSDGAADDDLNLSLLARGSNGGSAPPPLVAEIVVEDSSGALAVARDSMLLEFEGDSSLAGDIRAIRYLLAADEKPEAPQQEIAATVREGDRITISYTIDRSGIGGSTEAQAAAIITGLRSLLKSRGVEAELSENTSRSVGREGLPEEVALRSRVQVEVKSQTAMR